MAAWEARVAALEAERVDYRAVLSAVNALGANQREQAVRLSAIERDVNDLVPRVRSIEDSLTTDLLPRVRSIEDNLSDLKDLVIRALER